MKINCKARVKIDWGLVKEDEDEYKDLPDEACVKIEYCDNGDWEDTEKDMFAAAFEAVTKKFGVEPNEIVDILETK